MEKIMTGYYVAFAVVAVLAPLACSVLLVILASRSRCMFRQTSGALHGDSDPASVEVDSVKSRLRRPALITLVSPLIGVPIAFLALYGPAMVPALLDPAARSGWPWGFFVPALAVAPDAELGIFGVIAFFLVACVLAGWFIALAITYWHLSRRARSIASDDGLLGSKSDRIWFKSATIGAMLMGPGGAFVAVIGLVAASFVA